jgi:hypothetical protein
MSWADTWKLKNIHLLYKKSKNIIFLSFESDDFKLQVEIQKTVFVIYKQQQKLFFCFSLEFDVFKIEIDIQKNISFIFVEFCLKFFKKVAPTSPNMHFLYENDLGNRQNEVIQLQFQNFRKIKSKF